MNAPPTPASDPDRPTGTPRLPDADDGKPRSDEALREFFRGATPSGSAPRAGNWLPAALLAAQGSSEGPEHPVVVAPDGASATSLASLIAATGLPGPARHSEALLALVARAAGDAPPVGAVVGAAAAALVADVDASDDARRDLREQLDRLVDALPSAGTVLALDDAAPVRQYFVALEAARRAILADATLRARRALTRARELLEVDASHDPARATTEDVRNRLGGAAGFFDAVAFAGTIPPHRGSTRLDPRVVERLHRSITTLELFLKDDGAPRPIVLATGALPAGCLPADASLTTDSRAFEDAASAFDDAAPERVAVIAALGAIERIAARTWDEDADGPAFDRLGWEACSEAERALLRPVVVLHAAGDDEDARPDEVLSRFSRAIRSGRPIHALILDRTGGLGSELVNGRLSGGHRGEALAAVTQRAAFVVQGTAADPAGLQRALHALVTRARPAVAVVAVPGALTSTPEALLAAMREARGTIGFVYDPGVGESWADRFDVSGNPQPERIWPSYAATLAEGELVLELTFADAAALVDPLAGHFRLLEPSEWAADQVCLAEYLRDGDGHRARLPYIWVVRPGGELARALVSRELAAAALDRADLWRFVRELGGVDNQHAHRAAAEATRRAAREHEAELARIEAEHQAAIEAVRNAAAGEAIERLVGAILDLHESGPVASALARALPSAPSAADTGADASAVEAAAAAPAEVTAEEPDDEPVFSADPYIDTFLCTTCNECTNLNSLMFRYNGEKQAFIADASKGTFAQLVKAAESCPARCIHPGQPRAGDDTATADVIARAAVFN